MLITIHHLGLSSFVEGICQFIGTGLPNLCYAAVWCQTFCHLFGHVGEIPFIFKCLECPSNQGNFAAYAEIKCALLIILMRIC